MRKRKNNFKRNMSKFLATVMTVGLMAGSNVGMLTPKAATTAGQVLSVAGAEVGYHEKASNSNLDSKTANSGSADYTKYARDLGVANGYAWCAYFVWWCMRTAGVPADQYAQTGWVPSITNFYKGKGQYRARGTYTPKPGDVIIFGDSDHVGIVESANGSVVNTIEGNTTNQVARRSYSANSTYIMGYGIVNYVTDKKGPEVTDIKVISQTKDSYTVQCKVKDEYGVSFVTFPSWTQNKDQDDLEPGWWTSNSKSVGKLQGDTATFTVYKKDHKNEEGVYITHVYATDKNNNMACGGGVTITLDSSAPDVSDVEISNVSSDGYKVKFKAKDKYSKIKAVYCIPYAADGGQESIPSDWQEQSQYKVRREGDTYVYDMKAANHNGSGAYNTKIVVYDEFDNCGEYEINRVVVPESQNAVEQPSEEQPSEAPSSEEQPSEAPSSEEQPSEAPTSEAQPSEAPSSEEQPSEAPSSEAQPSEAPTSEEQPGEAPSSEEQPGEVPSSEEQPSEAPSSEAPTANEINAEEINIDNDVSVGVDSITVDNSSNDTINTTNNTTTNTTNNTNTTNTSNTSNTANTTNTSNTTNTTTNNTVNNITNVYEVSDSTTNADGYTGMPEVTPVIANESIATEATPDVSNGGIAPEEGVDYIVQTVSTKEDSIEYQLYEIFIYLYKLVLSAYVPDDYEVVAWNGETTDGVPEAVNDEAVSEKDTDMSFDTNIGGEDVKVKISFK